MDNNMPTLIAGKVPEGTGDTRSSNGNNQPVNVDAIANEIKSLVLPLVEKYLTDKVKEFENQNASKMVQLASNYPTRQEIDRTLRGFAQGIDNKYATKEETADQIDIEESNFITKEEAERIATDAVPMTLRSLDKDGGQRTGNQLLLMPGGTSGGDHAYWGTLSSGITAEGDKVLRKGIFLLEYDENGTIVAAGSEINPADYATQELYEAALTAAGHTLKPTWDWIKFVDTSA